MIVRIWQGWTTLKRANEYEILLQEEIFPEIRSKEIPGLKSIELLRLEGDTEARFMTLFRFENINDIELMAGDDSELAFVPESAKAVLSRYEDRASHFESRYDSNDERDLP